MYAARLAMTARSGLFGAAKLTAQAPGAAPARLNALRSYASDARSGFSRHAERRRAASLKEGAMAPTQGTPFQVGQGALIGGAAVGLGALCFYGLGFSNEPGAVDRQVAWPSYVRERIRDTYGYFGASLGITAASAAAVFRTPALLRLVAGSGWMGLIASMVAVIGAQVAVRSIPYEPGFGAKQLAWIGFSSLMGAFVAPVCVLGGPILMRAAWYTAGMVGGLSVVAACAPSDKFLYMGGPLALGLGVVIASSIGSAFLPPTTALGASLFSVSLYGGLLLFGGFLLYDTQRIVHKAERTPQQLTYDPINESIGIYVNTINIFIRIAQILGMQRRK